MIQGAYAHGIGKDSDGIDYHHTVLHAISEQGTLCGVTPKGKHWWMVSYVKKEHFLEEAEKYALRDVKNGDMLICKHCARKVKRIDEKNDGNHKV